SLSLVAINTSKPVVFTGYVVADTDSLDSEFLVPDEFVKARSSLFAVRSGLDQNLVGSDLLCPGSSRRERRSDCDHDDKNQGIVRSRLWHWFRLQVSSQATFAGAVPGVPN